jgi:ketosteroid isomerase-like protein
MTLRPFLAVALAASLAAGCSPTSKEQLKEEVLAADKAFCAKALKDGPQAAFESVIADNGKLLSEIRTGKDAVRTVFMQLPPSARVSWEPSYVDVADSGDLAYTWGRYTWTIPNVTPGKPPVMHRGTYVTIWRKTNYGVWKVVLDGGDQDREK